MTSGWETSLFQSLNAIQQIVLTTSIAVILLYTIAGILVKINRPHKEQCPTCKHPIYKNKIIKIIAEITVIIALLTSGMAIGIIIMIDHIINTGNIPV